MKKPKSLLIIIAIVSFTFTGCAERKVLEDIGLITTVGYDPLGKKKMRSTMVVMEINPEATQKINVISSVALSSKGGRIDGNLKASKVLQSGQLRVALYNEKLAKRGIKPFVDTLARDPSISDLTYLGIVEGSTKELLKHQYKNIPDIGQHLFNQIEQLTDKEQLSNATLQGVQQNYFSEGIDPILPLIIRDGEYVRVSGNAIMRNDKMVGKLTAMESFFVKLIRDDYHAGSVELTFDLNDTNGKKHTVTTVIDTINSSKEIELSRKNDPSFNLDLKIKGRLLEVQGAIDLMNPKNVSLLEKAIGDKIKREAIEVITYCKKRNSDVFGFGEVYRSSVRHANLTKSQWHQKYKDITYDLQVNFSLVRTGITE
ncbi:Ger(x)C family spore germination protein [Fictibacillus sp. 18YEL24]|uniref:Ger(x)C family spore germination protein n=1 Tax=Fictibacillus sp. 18YEL24 TaxID=2745875 RepID=UPI0018CE36E8|nr:Ger(x)C family spore germination protein [Fictibacillus sp. 18YEL24]MBH0171475.1 Ger(x)C family spore germination protein [Fictibacillus sp. 18YEL24]